uniref:Eukaryotic translation initiation factor 5B n=1 Tax=Henneguya salminicola TaxID=69463 RepID=A0A6G3ME35_HENSL
MKDFEYKIRGLSIIDTPGHFSFRNLRSLGSSLCDMAILIVDIMHSVEPQTEESIKLLLDKKTPFVVALNKIDLIVGWQSFPGESIEQMFERQSQRTKQHFDDLFKKTFTKFAELGLNIALFNENINPKQFISAVPTSARTGDGVGDLIACICQYSQKYLSKTLIISKELEATVMEVKVISGLGPTIDVILVNGSLSRGDRIIVPGLEGPIVSQIRALLTPQPMKEMRVKGSYIQHDCISICQGVKISGSNLEQAIAGLPIFVAQYDDEIDYYKNELSTLITKTINSFEIKDKGVYVQASTLGSLEALLDFLRQSKIPYFGINIGPVHKRDVINSMTMLEHNPMYAVILAFDVKIDTEAQLLANKNGVKIFTAPIIYHLYDQYIAYEKEYRKQQADKFRNLAVFPCILRILPESVFKTRDPIIVGVHIEEGTARIGTPLCVPTKNNLLIGTLASLEINHKAVDVAIKGQEVCIKIANFDGEAPKLLGRHFDISDQLVSKVIYLHITSHRFLENPLMS